MPVAYPGFQRGGCLRSGPIRKVGGGGASGPIRKVGGGGGGASGPIYEKWGGNSLRHEKWGWGGGGPFRFGSGPIPSTCTYLRAT